MLTITLRENETMRTIDKVVRPGSGPGGDVFCRIRYDGKRLSITGVVGPKPNGDCRGGAGQIQDHLSEDVRDYAPGWDAEKVARFAETWRRWHLNDMRAGCEHQRAEGWGAERLEVVTYGLTREAYRLRDEALQEVCRAALAGEVAQLTEAGKFLIGPDWFRDRFEAPDADSPLSGLYEVKKRESKLSGWVKPEEHPRGVLGKACPVCGYKYGTAWRFEEVPADVLEYLASLPDADKTPAWV